MTRWISGLAILLAAFWLVLSGHYSPLLLTLGGLSVFFVAWLARRMDIIDHEGVPLHLSLRTPLYWAWLGGQIVLSAIVVVRHVWSPRLSLRPEFIGVPAEGLSPLELTIYANSITLIPGSLPLGITDTEVEVHGLDPELMSDLKSGALLERIRRLEAT